MGTASTVGQEKTEAQCRPKTRGWAGKSHKFEHLLGCLPLHGQMGKNCSE